MQIYVEEPRRIKQNKKKLEMALNAKLFLSGRENILNISTKPEDEYIAVQVIEAINLGFKISDALLLKEEGVSFKEVRIKDVAQRRSSHISRIRGRILGTRGKALETLSNLANCIISVHNSTIGIIGIEEDTENAAEAIMKLIKGSKHGKVFAFLEKKRVEQKQRL